MFVSRAASLPLRRNYLHSSVKTMSTIGAAETKTTRAVVQLIRQRLAAEADSKQAPSMAKYMKTTPDKFYGIKKPIVKAVVKHAIQEHPPPSPEDYLVNLETLWDTQQREVKYAAIEYGKSFPTLVNGKALSAYERMLRNEEAWWDTVDDIASNLVGAVHRKDMQSIGPILTDWSRDDNMWIRRTSILAQLKHKAATDADQLFDICSRLAPEKEFFIRKAIGWALREYARTDRGKVIQFLNEHHNLLSNLSIREATKHFAWQPAQSDSTKEAGGRAKPKNTSSRAVKKRKTK